MAQVIRVYPVYSRGSPDEVLELETQFIKVWAALGTSKTGAINHIWFAGLKAVSDELGDKVDGKTIAIITKLEALRRQADSSDQELLAELYERMGLADFGEFCEAHEIDYEEFLRTYAIKSPTPATKTQAMLEWLKELLANGEEYEVGDIKAAAEIEGIIRDEQDWSLMKNVASREGYSSAAGRGFWRSIKS